VAQTLFGNKKEKMDANQIRDFVNAQWDQNIIPAIEEYIRIPNLSPAFDQDWASKPDTENAVKLMADWVQAQNLRGAHLEVHREDKRTPLIFITVEGTNKTQETIMMYGHLDKQPPTDGWLEDQGIFPYKPITKDGKLYGRGGADDGYAIFASVVSLKALQEQNIPHARIVIIIEACEESGSPDLKFYIEKLKSKIGTPSLIICLDSGCGNYEQLWLTTSLRGMVGAEITVKILNEGVHSGQASGIVPSSFRIFRQLLNRLEDVNTGTILPKEFYVDIPAAEFSRAQEAAKSLGETIYQEFPFVQGAHPVGKDLSELLLNRTWRPQLAVTGAAGFPPMERAGNVLRPQSAFTVSMRLPPTLTPKVACEALQQLIEKDPPYGAQIKCNVNKSAPGWAAPPMHEWLAKAAQDSSSTFFGKPVCYIGEGGTIPFMGMLGEMFPEAQFVITGILGPKANAHGPNEFLHIQMAKNLTSCVSSIVNQHYIQKVQNK